MNILDIIFPKTCIKCHKLGSYLCAKCRHCILQSELVCPYCERFSIGGATHPLCSKKFGLDGIWSLAIYQDEIKDLIHEFKYNFVKTIGGDLSGLLIEYWAKNTPLFLDLIKKDYGQNWVVVPVPLHPKRLNFRGFNQAEVVSRKLAKSLGLKYNNLLLRVKYTKPQVGLEESQRKFNIKGAFKLKKDLDLKDYSFLILDDVYTTGSTIKECCFILKKAGAKKVWGITIAK